MPFTFTLSHAWWKLRVTLRHQMGQWTSLQIAKAPFAVTTELLCPCLRASQGGGGSAAANKDADSMMAR